MLQPNRQVANAPPRGMVDNVGDGRGDTDHSDLADPLDPGCIHLLVLFRHKDCLNVHELVLTMR